MTFDESGVRGDICQPRMELDSANAIASSIAILEKLIPRGQRHFDVRFWNGHLLPGDGSGRFVLHLRHPGSLRVMLASIDEASFGEAYIYGDVDIEGDLEALGPVADNVLTRRYSVAERMSVLAVLRRLPREQRPRAGVRPARLRGRLHSKDRDRAAIRYHYDVSNDFYRLWLDKQMVYSCAYFVDAHDDLDTAQEQKLDYVCRKLRLRPGDRLLDIGCGWGALLIHAARHFSVHAFGVTLSERQYELARERIARLDLIDRCQVKLCDFRDIEEPEGYDKIVSVGMFEHVGADCLREYFCRAWRLLRPGGVFLNHGVGRGTIPLRKGPLFANRFGFPDSDIVPLGEAVAAAESAGFEVRDVESLREHYVLTLRHWIRRMAERHDEVVQIANESTFRAWQLVMSGGAYGMDVGRLNIWQMLLSKRGGNSFPLTRHDWYDVQQS